jgi:hypothetical protein
MIQHSVVLKSLSVDYYTANDNDEGAPQDIALILTA